MEVTVKMTVEEYDAYRAYQKDADALEREANGRFYALRDKHESLCTSLLNAVREKKDSTAGEPSFEIVEQGHLTDAVDMASEWFS